MALKKSKKIKKSEVDINQQVKEQIENANIRKKLIDTYDVTVYEDAIYINSKKGFYKVCDFAFFIKYIIKDSRDEVYRILEVPQTNGENLFIKIKNKEFASVSKIQETFIKYQLVFDIEPKDYLKLIAAMDKVKTSKMIDILGYNSESNAYFFSNAVLYKDEVLFPNNFGMVEIEKQSYFMPYVENSMTEVQTQFKNALRFKYLKNSRDMKFNEWYKLIIKAHRQEATIPVCFTIASMFRDIIFNKLHFCPILYIKGVRGSGKSSLARNLTSLFGYTQHEISLKSPNTTKSLPRLLGQLSNSILWLDEFHNNLSDDIRGMLQSVYDGGGYEKAAFTNGIETTSVSILSMLLLTSNYIPEDEIFFSRTILVQMNETSKTDEQRTAYKEITEIEKNGLSSVAIDIMQHRELILEKWHKNYEFIFKTLSTKFVDFKIDNRFLENLTATITPAYILIKEKKLKFAENDLKYELKLIDMAYNLIKSQYNIFYDNNIILEFWNIIQMLYDIDLIKKDVEIKLITIKSTDDVLAIRFNRLYEHYRKQLGNKAKSKDLILEQLLNHESFIETKKSVRFIKPEEEAFNVNKEQFEFHDKKTSTVQSAMLFDYKRLNDSIGIKF